MNESNGDNIYAISVYKIYSYIIMRKEINDKMKVKPRGQIMKSDRY